METPKNEPWNFCETPEEKCTMNYCDDNGCQNRKRALVSEPQKLETLYRKVQFEINKKDHDEIWLIGKNANFIFNPNTRNGEELFDFLSCCEEITDNSHQIEKLEAEKAELLKALEEVKMGIFQMSFDQLELLYTEIESLIQKMKK